MFTRIKGKFIDVSRRVLVVLFSIAGFMMIFSSVSNGTDGFILTGFKSVYIVLLAFIIITGVPCSVYSAGGIRSWLREKWYLLMYLCFRVASGFVNGIAATAPFWFEVFYETFFLIAIDSYTINKRIIRIFICMFMAFDVLSISMISCYRYIVLRETGGSIIKGITETGGKYVPFDLIFGNPNTAGLIAGLAFVICVIACINYSGILRYASVIVALCNVAFMIWANCRNAMVSSAVSLAFVCMVVLTDRIDAQKLLAVLVIICICWLIPVYISTAISESEGHLLNNQTEEMLNGISSGRYNIWKHYIIVQKGHYVFGYGSTGNMRKARAEMLDAASEASKEGEISESHRNSGREFGAHNGFLELMLLTGLPAFAMILFFLYRRLGTLDDAYIRDNKIVMALVYLFCICIQESAFIATSLHYFVFLMMLLLCRIEEDIHEAA